MDAKEVSLPRPPHLSHKELRRLCRKFPVWDTPEDVKTKEGQPAKQPRVKHFRKTAPDEKLREQWANVEQGTPEWHGFRSADPGTVGSSGLGATCGGWCKFRNNVLEYLVHAGFLAEEEREAKDFCFMDHGHHWEPDALRNYKIVMQCRKARPTGMYSNLRNPNNHTSPDSINDHDPLVIHNTLLTQLGEQLRATQDADVRRRLITAFFKNLSEIKNPIYSAHVTRLSRDKNKWNAPHTVPPEYMLQMQNQMDTMAQQPEFKDVAEMSDDFNSHHKTTSLKPMTLWTLATVAGNMPARKRKAMDASDEQQPLLKRQRLDQQGSSSSSSSSSSVSNEAWRIGHMLITRVFKSQAFCDEILRYINAHAQAVEACNKGNSAEPTLPKVLNKQDTFGKVKLVPLKQVMWFVHQHPTLHPEFTHMKYDDRTEVQHHTMKLRKRKRLGGQRIDLALFPVRDVVLALANDRDLFRQLVAPDDYGDWDRNWSKNEQKRISHVYELKKAEHAGAKQLLQDLAKKDLDDRIEAQSTTKYITVVVEHFWCHYVQEVTMTELDER